MRLKSYDEDEDEVDDDVTEREVVSSFGSRTIAPAS